jgi:hypothetical protein
VDKTWQERQGKRSHYIDMPTAPGCMRLCASAIQVFEIEHQKAGTARRQKAYICLAFNRLMK